MCNKSIKFASKKVLTCTSQINAPSLISDVMCLRGASRYLNSSFKMTISLSYFTCLKKHF